MKKPIVKEENPEFKRQAEETLKILQTGEGTPTPISVDLSYCVNNTEVYLPTDLEELLSIFDRPQQYFVDTQISVTKESTMAAIDRLIEGGTESGISVLNFASGTCPGGGWLKGRTAQEESLARSSGLYSSLLKGQKYYYDRHNAQRGGIYSDTMIFSPGCPVFRDQYGNLCDTYTVNFITSAAVNRPAVGEHTPEMVPLIPSIMDVRIDKMLALAAKTTSFDTLILGAWGCGVFGNDPVMIADLFAKYLKGKYDKVFHRVIFAIYDNTDTIFNTFKERLTP